MDLPIKSYLFRLYVGALGFFAVNKLIIRPVTSDASVPRWLEVLIYSSPNLVEAVVGMTTVAVLLLLARRRVGRGWSWASDSVIYGLSALLAGSYVLSQEFKLHDLGGRNVFDPLDAAASAVGVVAMWGLFLRYGVLVETSGRHSAPPDVGS